MTSNMVRPSGTRRAVVLGRVALAGAIVAGGLALTACGGPSNGADPSVDLNRNHSTTSSAAATSTQTAAPLSKGAQAVVAALPKPIQQELGKACPSTEKAAEDSTDHFTVKVNFCLAPTDALTTGLARPHGTASDNVNGFVYFNTRPADLADMWHTIRPEQLVQDDAKLMVRIDDGTPGLVSLEVFRKSDGLYLNALNFTSKDAAEQFVHRAGF